MGAPGAEFLVKRTRNAGYRKEAASATLCRR
jgi:hypothetical protein